MILPVVKLIIILMNSLLLYNILLLYTVFNIYYTINNVFYNTFITFVGIIILNSQYFLICW